MRIDIVHHNPSARLPTLWGVWLPGEGWLKASKPTGEISACAFERKNEAVSVARILHGRVQYIDDSLASTSVESKLKEAEMIRKNKETSCLIYRIWSHKRSK